MAELSPDLMQALYAHGRIIRHHRWTERELDSRRTTQEVTLVTRGLLRWESDLGYVPTKAGWELIQHHEEWVDRPAKYAREALF